MLYHFSDTPDIKKFIPRTISYSPELPRAVWAIDEEHSVNYFFERNCPRIVYVRSENLHPDDEQKFFGDTTAKKIITIEEHRKEQLKNAVIYKYSFEEEGFELYDETSGYYVSYDEITPVKVEMMDNLHEKIPEAGAELRFIDDLHSLKDEIMKSTIDIYSIIRLID